MTLSSLVSTLAPPPTRATARATYAGACVLAGSLAIAALAQVSIRLPFTPVPITGQTLGVLVVGAAFGPGLGALTLALYLLEGAIGMPVFAPQADGTHLTGPAVLSPGSATGGYLWASWRRRRSSDGCRGEAGIVHSGPRSARCSWPSS
jgi:biotin transport system substrate-specific component